MSLVPSSRWNRLLHTWKQEPILLFCYIVVIGATLLGVLGLLNITGNGKGNIIYIIDLMVAAPTFGLAIWIHRSKSKIPRFMFISMITVACVFTITRIETTSVSAMIAISFPVLVTLLVTESIYSLLMFPLMLAVGILFSPAGILLIIDPVLVVFNIILLITLWGVRSQAIEASQEVLVAQIQQNEALKAAELAQIKQEEASRANLQKSKFLATMSHELRTPLNAITGYLSLLTDEPLSDMQLYQIQRAEVNAEHLLSLINDVLDLSKIEAGKMEFFPEQVSIKELIEGVMSTFKGLMEEKELDFSVVYGCDEIPLVHVDKRRIRQVLLNLLSNAAKFTPSGSVSLLVNKSDGFIQISVVDTGIGINPENQKSIFEEFTQVQDNLNREYEGTGLGLPISRRLIEDMHGGKLWFENNSVGGSIFHFTLPIKNGIPSSIVDTRISISQEDETSDYNGEKTIVIIDDDLDAQVIFQNYLRGTDYTIIPVTDSRQAIRKVQDHRPGLIILDIQMPHYSGWEILSELKSTPETGFIPVVICSIVDNKNVGTALGAVDHLVKPIHPDIFIGAVKKYNSNPNGTIAIIDDNFDMRQILRRQLENAGYNTVVAEDGYEGLRIIQQHKPSLIILDLMMPKMDGFDFLTKLRSIKDFKDLPVVVLSAKDLTIEEFRLLDLAVSQYIHKNKIDMNEFIKTITLYF